MASNYLFLQSEVISKKFGEWQTKKFNVLTDFIKKGTVEQIGERDFRYAFLTSEGGRVGTYNPQMGDMGRGTAMLGSYLTGSYFPLRLNFELDALSVKATQDKKIALQEPLKRAVAKGFVEFQTYLDKFYHSNGTAKLATAVSHTTSGGKSIYTLDSTFGCKRLRRGMPVTVYATALASVKSANTALIESMDITARKVTLSLTVPAGANTDELCFEGVSGATPTGLRGIYYWNDYSTSGTTAGVNRATEPEIIANSVSAAGGLTPEMGMALYHRIFERRGAVADSILGLCPPPQQANIYTNVMSIQNYDLAKSAADATDRLPALKGKKYFTWCGMPHYLDPHQDTTRIDYIVPDTFGRCRLDDMKFFSIPGSNQRFYHLTGASGGPLAGTWFGLVCDEDIINYDPGANGVIYACPLPSSGLYT